MVESPFNGSSVIAITYHNFIGTSVNKVDVSILPLAKVTMTIKNRKKTK